MKKQPHVAPGRRMSSSSGHSSQGTSLTSDKKHNYTQKRNFGNTQLRKINTTHTHKHNFANRKQQREL